MYKKALLIKEKVLGEEHPSTATSYNNLAEVYIGQRKYKLALIYFYKAYKNFLSIFGADHTKTQIVYENLELAYKEFNPDGNFKQWLEEKMNQTE